MHLDQRAASVPFPTPLVVTSSGKFDGNDGKWSSFIINIGDNGSAVGQNFRVLPSISSGISLVPQQVGWCFEDEGCPQSRGIESFNGRPSSGFDENSGDWNQAGLYGIPMPYWFSPSLSLDPEGPRGTFGVSSIGLGTSSRQSIVLTDQYVVMYQSNDFFMGWLGLTVGQTSAGVGSRPNYLDNLYGTPNMTIMSRSFGYSAGAWYKNNEQGIPGTLILGGYDKSRFEDNGISIKMPSETNTSLIVGVQSITYTPVQGVESNRESLTFDQKDGFYAVIDSLLPYLILPDKICDQLAQKFRLEYVEESKLYFVNTSSHNWNTQQKANMSFKIGLGTRDSEDFADITLPYAAFTQEIGPPLINTTRQYFPIKRSENGIYVLGRTFLQEAYIIVDFERANFTVAPAYFENDKPNLITIFDKTYSAPRPTSSDANDGLPAGTIAGIVVGIVVAFIIAAIGAFLFWRKRRNATKHDPEVEKPSEIDTMHAGNEVKYRRVSELTGSEAPQSPKDLHTGYYNGDHKAIPPISEMSPESTPAELYSPPPDGGNSFDYFAAGRVRRRGATRDRDLADNLTPRTPIAELPGDDAMITVHGSKDGRGPSDTSLSTKIDQVLAARQVGTDEIHPALQPGWPATSEEIARSKAGAASVDTDHDQQQSVERRPSHARGLSDTTIQSDSTAVSQPSPEELEHWARSGEDGPPRPMSP